MIMKAGLVILALVGLFAVVLGMNANIQSVGSFMVYGVLLIGVSISACLYLRDNRA